MFTHSRIIAKSLIFVLICTFISFYKIPVSQAASATSISSVSVTDNIDIYEGDEFTLVITFNGLAKDFVISDTTNFRPVNGVVSWTYDSGVSVWSMRLVSLGKENTLPIKWTPYMTSGNSGEENSQTVVVPGFMRSNNNTQTSVDTFSINTSGVREVVAGTDTTLEIPVKVKNTTTLKNVTMSIISPTDESLFSSEGTEFSKNISDINKSMPTVGYMKVRINPNAKSKLYEVKFSFKYMTSAGTVLYDDVNNVMKLRVRSNQMEPTLNVVDYQMGTPKITAGEKQTLSLTIQNMGTLVASDVRIKLSGFDKDHIRLSNDGDTKQLYSLSGKEKTVVDFNIAASDNAKTESDELTAEISYVDDLGKEYKQTSKVFVQVDGNDVSNVDLSVENIKYAQQVKAGGNFSIEFDLKNNGKVKARTVEVGIEYPNTSIVPKNAPKRVIRTFNGGQVQHYKFDFNVKEDAITGFNDMYINVKYNIDGGKDTDALSLREFAGVQVDGAAGLGRPKVIIDNYNFGASTVLSGQEFDLNLDLLNTSSSEAVKNIKVSMKPEEGAFAPIDSSSTFFISQIGPMASYSKSIRMKTKNDAAVKAYNIVVTFEYEDSKGNAYDAQKNPYKEEETISVPVNQPIRIETGEMTFSPEIYINQPVPLSMEFFNLGRSTVYNLMVKAEGDFQVQGGNYFVGNFEAGRSDFFETQITPTVEGDAKGKIIFMYEDANGVPGVYEKDFSMNVMAAPVDPNVNPDGTPINGENTDEQTKAPVPHAKLVILGILSGIGVVFVGVILWKRRFERKKLVLVEDEDE